MTEVAEGLTAPPVRVLGQLEGRMSALEDRMTRHEASIAAKLVSIEGKLDNVCTALAQGLGGMKVFHWLAGLGLATVGFLASHFWQGKI